MLHEASELEDFQWNSTHPGRICLLRNTTTNKHKEWTRCKCYDYEKRPRKCTRKWDTTIFLGDHSQTRRTGDRFHKRRKVLSTTLRRALENFRPKGDNERLIESYLQYQNKDLVWYIKEFDFCYSDLTDDELVLLIDLLMGARDVYSQHKFDVGRTRHRFNFHLEPGAILERQRPAKYLYNNDKS